MRKDWYFMANIKVCDRCGKQLPDITTRFIFTLRHNRSISISGWMINNYYDYLPDQYDLCEGCYCDFIKFMGKQLLKGKD